MVSESAGVEQCSGDVVQDISEAQGGAAQVFDASVNRFGGSVAGSGMVEIGHEVIGPTFHGPSQPLQLCEFIRNTATDRVDYLDRVCFGSVFVRVAKSSHDLLLDLPGGMDWLVTIVCKHLIQADPLFFGQGVLAGQQRFAGTIERVTAAAATVQGGLLGALAALIQCLAGQRNDIEGIHDRGGPPDMLINSQDSDTVEPGGVIDE